MSHWDFELLAKDWQESGAVSALEIWQARVLGRQMARGGLCASEEALVFLLVLLALHRRGHTAVGDSELVLELASYPVMHQALPSLLERLRGAPYGMLAPMESPAAIQALVVWARGRGTCVWGFQRAWLAETRIANQIQRWMDGSHTPSSLDEKSVQQALDQATHLCFAEGQKPHEHQLQAVRAALQKPFSIISGGPGTGKTTVVKMIVSAVCSVYNITPDRVVLCAPTGRAKARLEESIHKDLPSDSPLRQVVGRTLHSLLRYRTDGTPSFHQANPLPYDLVVVDEVSMVDSVQFASLAGALASTSRLVVVGDKDQLPSVESGAVLADLIQALGSQVAYLTQNFRTDRSIIQWWESLQNQTPCEVADPRVSLESLDSHLLEWGHEWKRLWMALRPKTSHAVSTISIRAFKELVECGRVLCLANQGAGGRAGLNERCQRLFHSSHQRPRHFNDGEPLIVEQNQRLGDVELYNGDLGVAWIEGRRAYGLFYSSGGVRQVELSRVQGLNRAYAIAVPKSQGSEFSKVIFVRPYDDSR